MPATACGRPEGQARVLRASTAATIPTADARRHVRPGIARILALLHRCAVAVVPPSPTLREHLQALALALLCAVAFLGSALLPGRALVPHPPELFDVAMAQAHAAGAFDPADAFRGNVGMTDKYLQSLCWDRVLQDRFARGELPRWTNDIGGGAPFVPQMAQPYQPINLLLLLLPSEQWYGWWFLIHQVLFGWFAYCFLRRLGCAHGAALVGLVAAALGLWTQSKLHHNVILTAALSVWPMLGSAHELVAQGARGRARTFAVGWLGLWTGLSWATGFVVVALQATGLVLAASLLFVAAAPAGDRLRRLVPVALGLLLGAWIATANMTPILLASAESARPAKWTTEQLAALGLEWDHALALVWPDLLAWAADRFYVPAGDGPPFGFETKVPWSQLVLLERPFRADGSGFQNWVETSAAIGLLPLGATAAAFSDRARRGLALGFLAFGVLAFGFATADPPFPTLARCLPGLAAGDLRRQLFVVFVALVVLAGLGADALQRGRGRLPAAILLGAAAAASLALLGFLWQNRDEGAFVRRTAELLVADADHPDVRPFAGDPAAAAAAIAAAARPGEAAHNQAMLATTAGRALLIAALALGSLWLRARLAVALWLLLTGAELWHAGRGPVQTVPAERVTRVPAVLAPLAAANPGNGDRPRLCRLVAEGAGAAACWPGNLPGFQRLEDSAAYNPLPKARYEQFFAAIDPTAVLGGAGVGAFRRPQAVLHPLCDLYGMRFLLTKEPVPEVASLVDRTPPGTGAFRLYERTTALDRATFVRQVDVIADAAQRLAALADPQRDVQHRVVLEDPSAPAVDAAAPGDAVVRLVERRDERVVVRVQTPVAGYLRLADPWDAGWRASRNGELVPIYVADHYLRAVHVPAGDHEIVFTYDAPRVVWPLRLTLLGCAVAAVLLWRGRRRA